MIPRGAEAKDKIVFQEDAWYFISNISILGHMVKLWQTLICLKDEWA